MKFDELCEFVLIGEADRDTLTGKDKVFSLSDDALEIAQGLSQKDPDLQSVVRRSALPISVEYIIGLVKDDLADYLPAETGDLMTMLKRNIWSTFDDTEKKSERTAKFVFSLLKSRKIIQTGIKKNDEPSETDIDSLARELESDVDEDDYSSGLSTDQVSKFGGMIPRSTGHPEDESKWY